MYSTVVDKEHGLRRLIRGTVRRGLSRILLTLSADGLAFANRGGGVVTPSWMPSVEARMKSIKKQVYLGILILAVALLGGRTGYGQAVYGSLYGTGTDNTGASVPHARVTRTDVSKGIQSVVQSNEEGFCHATTLIPATSTIQLPTRALSPP